MSRDLPASTARPPMFIIDSFGTSLGSMPTKAKRNIASVFDAMVRLGRFSAFDIDDHLAGPVTEIMQRGYLRAVGGDYPYTVTEITERGREWRAGKICLCPDCNGEGFIPTRLSKSVAVAETCERCAGTGFIPAQVGAA